MARRRAHVATPRANDNHHPAIGSMIAIAARGRGSGTNALDRGRKFAIFRNTGLFRCHDDRQISLHTAVRPAKNQASRTGTRPRCIPVPSTKPGARSPRPSDGPVPEWLLGAGDLLPALTPVWSMPQPPLSTHQDVTVTADPVLIAYTVRRSSRTGRLTGRVSDTPMRTTPARD